MSHKPSVCDDGKSWNVGNPCSCVSIFPTGWEGWEDWVTIFKSRSDSHLRLFLLCRCILGFLPISSYFSHSPAHDTLRTLCDLECAIIHPRNIITSPYEEPKLYKSGLKEKDKSSNSYQEKSFAKWAFSLTWEKDKDEKQRNGGPRGHLSQCIVWALESHTPEFPSKLCHQWVIWPWISHASSLPQFP